jgi:hypothetical protein
VNPEEKERTEGDRLIYLGVFFITIIVSKKAILVYSIRYYCFLQAIADFGFTIQI